MHSSVLLTFLLIIVSAGNRVWSVPVPGSHQNHDDTTNRAETRIILPKNDNDGKPLTEVQLKFEEIIAKYGGFTRFDGFGGWYSTSANKTYTENVWVYDIAIANPNTVSVRKELYDLAVLAPCRS